MRKETLLMTKNFEKELICAIVWEGELGVLGT